MSETLAVQSNYDAVLSRLRAQDRLSLIAPPTYSDVSKHWVAADYVVDLGKAYQEATKKGARSLEVFADTVTVPDKFVAALGRDALMVLSIVARAVKVKGTPAAIQLFDTTSAPRPPAVRVLADTIEGDLQVQLIPPNGNVTTTASIDAADGPLLFCAYTCSKGELVKTAGSLPFDMLAAGEPLYQVLIGSFDLAAGTLEDSSRTENLELARAVFHWLSRWSTYPTSDLAQLCRAATALGQLLPARSADGNLVFSVPPLSARSYQTVFQSQMDVAEKYELDASFTGIHSDIDKIVENLVSTWGKRDVQDSLALQGEIDEASGTLDATKTALVQAAKDIVNRKLEFELQAIELETEIKLDRINQIVKATFDIVKAVVEIGIGIGLVVAGDPAGLTGAAKDIKDTTQFIAGANASLADKAKPMLELLYGQSLKRVAEGLWADKALLGKGFKVAAPGFVSLMDAATIIRGIDLPLDDLNKVDEAIKQVGALVGSTTNVPDPVTSKAIWDSFEVEAVNQLEAIIGDAETAKAVKEAALKYKTSLQKYAIYGRLQSEQQALLAQQTRSLGTLKIQQGAMVQKQAALKALTQDLSQQDQVIQTLQDARSNRLRDLRRAAYVSLANFRAAYFYENLAWPAAIATLSRSVDELKEQAATITLDLENRKANSRRSHPKCVLTDPTLLADLKEKRESMIAFAPTDDAFSPYRRVRLSEVYVWLDGVKALNAAVPITVELRSAQFEDRTALNQTYAFSTSKPASIRFAYRTKEDIESSDVLDVAPPTPFASWTLHIGNQPEELDFSGFTSVTVEMTAFSEAV